MIVVATLLKKKKIKKLVGIGDDKYEKKMLKDIEKKKEKEKGRNIICKKKFGN